MPTSASRGKLSHKMMFWFLLISLVPVAVVGWHLVDTSLTTMKEVSLRNLQSHAKGFADTVSNSLQGFKDVLIATARLGEFASMQPLQQEEYLKRVMVLNEAFLELSVVDLKGKERVRIQRFLQKDVRLRDFFEAPSFQTALQRNDYVGALERIQGAHPAITIAVPILGDTAERSTPTVRGVLMGKVNLSGLSNTLQETFSQRSRVEAAMATPDGYLVAHSDPTRVYQSEPKLGKEVIAFLVRRSTDTGGGEIVLADGSSIVAAYAAVRDLGWLVCVQQPLESAYVAATRMRRQIGRILLWVIAITVVLSLAVAAHITLPIRELQFAADQLKMGRFEDLPDMTLTNDEIGDLAEEFMQMSDVIKGKTDELVRAKAELERFQETLERRVHARERELQSAQDELIGKERLAAMGQMASVVGHEIRNPLAVINNSTFFIKTKLNRANQLDDKLGKHIGLIESSISQASSIINEILTYSRSRELKPQVTTLNHFMNETLANFEFPPQVKVVRLFGEPDPVVNIDLEEMRQSVRNILSNAVDVLPRGGGIYVTTKVVEESWARVDIRDTGPGIPPDVLDHIFSPFFSTKAVGTGLGLAVVKKVIERHEGRVEVFTEPGKGSQFRLLIPLLKGAPYGPDQPISPT